MHFWGESCKFEYKHKVGMGNFYSYQVNSVRLANLKYKMTAIFHDGCQQIDFSSENWAN